MAKDKIDELFPELNFDFIRNGVIADCKQALVGKVWLKVGVEEIVEVLNACGFDTVNETAQAIVDYLEGVGK